MIRNILAVIAGIVVGMTFNYVMVMLNTALYPMPDGVNFDDMDMLVEYFSNLPFSAYLIILVAHLGQAFLGGMVSAVISRNAVMTVAIIVGLVSMIGGIINMILLPLPNWMWIESPLYLVAAWLAARVVLARRASAT